MAGFFRLLAVRVAYSRQLRCQLPNTSDATQSDCICISTTHYRTLHRLLHFSCASPASPHLPAYLSNVSPFSSVPRLAHFAEKDSLFRDTRQSLACRTHAPSQPPTNTHVPDLSGTVIFIVIITGFQSVATHDPLPFLRSDAPDFSHADATFSPLCPPLFLCPASLPPHIRPSNTSVGRCKSTMPMAISGALSATAT